MLAVGRSVGAQALALMVERGGRGDGKKTSRLQHLRELQSPAGAMAPALVAGVP